MRQAALMIGLPVTLTLILSVAALSALLATCCVWLALHQASGREFVLTGGGALVSAVLAWSFKQQRRRSGG